MWSLPIRQSLKTSGGVSYEKPSSPFQTENDTLIISTDSNPSPGVSRVSVTCGITCRLRNQFDPNVADCETIGEG